MTQPAYMSDGGYRTFTQYSGTALANDVLIQSGAGRLNQIMPITQMQSGQAVLFYDSAIATSGGPFAASGHKVVGVLPATWQGGAVGSGFGAQSITAFTGFPFQIDLPFQSGLCAATRSGTGGFTVGYTLEQPQQ